MISIGFLYKKLLLNTKMAIKSSRYIKSVDRLIISNDKWMEIIQIGEKIMLIGITAGSMELIANLNEEDLCETDESREQVDFAKIFSKYYKNKKV
jgi:flagellar biogenesis protein FliO